MDFSVSTSEWDAEMASSSDLAMDFSFSDIPIPPPPYGLDGAQTLSLPSDALWSTNDIFPTNLYTQTSQSAAPVSPQYSSSQQSSINVSQYSDNPPPPDYNLWMEYELNMQREGHVSLGEPPVQESTHDVLVPPLHQQNFASTTPSPHSSTSAGASTSSPLSPSLPPSRRAKHDAKGKGRARAQPVDADLERLREKNRGYQAKRRQKLNTTLQELESKLAERDETVARLKEENNQLKGKLAGMEAVLNGGRTATS